MCYLAFSANEKKDNLKEVRSQITTTAEKTDQSSQESQGDVQSEDS